MKAYYYAHESAYKQIKKKGYVGWGNAKTLDELSDPTTQDYIKSSIEKWLLCPKGKNALDLGCGSGTTAFFLAKEGLRVTGIDISETAIELAKELSSKQNLNIDFLVADVLHLEKMNQRFDLIYDSHCFHCIVFEEDRFKVLDGVKKSLNDSGIFILDTMVMAHNYNPCADKDNLRFDNEFILWHKTSSTDYRGIVEIDGEHWCAQRRIYPAIKVMDEIKQTGFKILSKSLDLQKQGEPGMLRLILGF